MRDVRTAEFDQFGFRGRGIRLQHHQRLGYFTPLLVGNRNHRGLQHRGMREDGLFEFERGDILAAADDDVFLAVDHQQVAVFVERGHVSGVEPAAAQSFGGGLRLPPVTLHHAVAARDDFADGLAIVRHVLIVGVHDAHFHAGNGESGHRLARVALLAFPLQPGFHPRNRKRRGCFGQAVTRKAFAAELFFHLANQGGRRCRAADGNAPQAAQIVIAALRAIHQSGGHDGNQAAGMDALGFDEAENFLRVEALDHHVLSADQGQEMRHAPAIRVEERNGVEFDGAAFDLESHADVQRVKIHISVGEHHTFGIGAGAAGIEKLRHSVFVDRGDVGAIRCRCSEKSFVVLRRRATPLRERHSVGRIVFTEGISLRNDSAKPKKLLFHEKDCRPGVIEDVAQLVGCKPDVQRQQNGAGFQNPVIRFQQAVTIAAEECHSIAGLDAGLAQRARQAADPLAELSVRVSVVIADDRGPAGKLLLGVSQETQRREWNIHGVPRLDQAD